jgi:hypothetical protein
MMLFAFFQNEYNQAETLKNIFVYDNIDSFVDPTSFDDIRGSEDMWDWCVAYHSRSLRSLSLFSLSSLSLFSLVSRSLALALCLPYSTNLTTPQV